MPPDHSTLLRKGSRRSYFPLFFLRPIKRRPPTRTYASYPTPSLPAPEDAAYFSGLPLILYPMYSLPPPPQPCLVYSELTGFNVFFLLWSVMIAVSFPPPPPPPPKFFGFSVGPFNPFDKKKFFPVNGDRSFSSNLPRILLPPWFLPITS